MANIPVQLRRMATQSEAEQSELVLLDGQPIRIIDSGRVYWGNGSDDLATLVMSGKYTVPSEELAGVLRDGDVVHTGLQFRDGALRLNDTVNGRLMLLRALDGQTANRSLFIGVNDADRRLIVAANATISGTNTGDDASDPAGSAAAALADAQAYADSLVVSVFRAAGNWDASTGSWPTTGTGTGGAVRRGDTYNVSVAGVIDGRAFDVGDAFYASSNAPGQTSAHWSKFEANTDQATEAERGTARVATQAAAENDATTNDVDLVTPKKLWQAIVKERTLGGFLAAVRGTLLTGLSTGSSAAVVATDTILSALGKLQAFNSLFTAVGLAIARLPNPGAVRFVRVNADNTASAITEAELRAELGLAPTFLSYSGGSQSFASTALATVSGTTMPLPSTGFYEVEYTVAYDAAAVTTGSGWGIATQGGLQSDYFSLITIMEVSQAGAMNVSPARSGSSTIFNGTSRFTVGNTAIVRLRINVTAPGSVALRCMSEVNGSAITVTDVQGFVKR